MDNSTSTKAVVIIPAYQPNGALLSLVEAIHQLSPSQPIIVVNDGSSDNRQSDVFDKLEQITLLHHPRNLGKGAAIKTGIHYYKEHLAGPSPGVVTADADGQHDPNDIITLCQALEGNPGALHLGVRTLKTDVPWRSRFGNNLTVTVFYWFTGKRLMDTQTGLRAVPRERLNQITESSLRGYDLELEFLLKTTSDNYPINEIPISTIYENNNASSHFRPFRDSIKIYATFIRFLWKQFCRRKH